MELSSITTTIDPGGRRTGCVEHLLALAGSTDIDVIAGGWDVVHSASASRTRGPGCAVPAFNDDVLTAVELKQLRNAAALLNAPGYFDDLQPTISPTTTKAAKQLPNTGAVTPKTVKSKETATQEVKQQRRCGHCRQMGHYRTTCPELKS